MDDFRFMLLRHWSLYESLLHSSYVAVRLQTWASKGRTTIEDMLTAMGLPLQQAKLSYGAPLCSSLRLTPSVVEVPRVWCWPGVLSTRGVTGCHSKLPIRCPSLEASALLSFCPNKWFA